LSRTKILLTLTLLLSVQGCIVAPLRVAEPLDVRVVDAQDGAPIPGATVIYFVCDIHDFRCEHAALMRTTSNASGGLKIEGRRRWGVWIPTPGGLPVPNHFIAIWAPRYSAFVFGQYGDTVESIKKRVPRQDVLEAFDSISSDRSSSDPSLNPKEELIGGKIRLRKSAA
jgi:hypothetical protein